MTLVMMQLSSASLSFCLPFAFHLAYDETGRHFSERGIEIINRDAHFVARSRESTFGGFLVSAVASSDVIPNCDRGVKLRY